MEQQHRLSRLLAAALAVLAPAMLVAHSGSASLHGWVAFEGTQTDEHGFFQFSHTSLGQFTLRITAPRFQPYQAEVYMPSDFAGNWAVQMRAQRAAVPSK